MWRRPAIFFYQNDVHVSLTKQLYKINCEIIKIKLIEKKHIIKQWQNIYKTLTTSFGCSGNGEKLG